LIVVSVLPEADIVWLQAVCRVAVDAHTEKVSRRMCDFISLEINYSVTNDTRMARRYRL
jgi:hypothetical protein